jgi:hypothetical protein
MQHSERPSSTFADHGYGELTPRSVPVRFGTSAGWRPLVDVPHFAAGLGELERTGAVKPRFGLCFPSARCGGVWRGRRRLRVPARVPERAASGERFVGVERAAEVGGLLGAVGFT